MTGDCKSTRAYSLIRKCAVRVYNSSPYFIFNGDLNGKPKKVDPKLRLNSYVSPIEKFLHEYKPTISKESTKIRKLIAFLKDETKTLTF